jgi:dUTP pyrophosphatase
MSLLFSKLYPDAVTPTRKHVTDAGVDVYAYGDYIVKPHNFKIIETGITFHFPKNYVMLVKPKSRNDWLIGAGVVDQEYQGQLLVKVVNYTDETMIIRQGDAVAQVLVIPCMVFPLEEGQLIHTEPTERGASGGIVTQGVTQLTFLANQDEF